MAKIPKKVRERLASGLKRFQPIVEAAKARDVNEADTLSSILIARSQNVRRTRS
ncbi:MAG: hypothetical protein ACRD2J_04570 [Thermoanaerobaculia bacterium]